MGFVRTLIRYLLVTSVVLSLVWCGFVVRVGDRTVFGHVRRLTERSFDSVLARIRANVDERIEQLSPDKKKKPVERAAPNARVQAQHATSDADNLQTARVKNLRDAESVLASSSKTARPAPRAKIDERLDENHRRSLERLVDSSQKNAHATR